MTATSPAGTNPGPDYFGGAGSAAAVRGAELRQLVGDRRDPLAVGPQDLQVRPDRLGLLLPRLAPDADGLGFEARDLLVEELPRGFVRRGRPPVSKGGQGLLEKCEDVRVQLRRRRRRLRLENPLAHPEVLLGRYGELSGGAHLRGPRQRGAGDPFLPLQRRPRPGGRVGADRRLPDLQERFDLGNGQDGVGRGTVGLPLGQGRAPRLPVRAPPRGGFPAGAGAESERRDEGEGDERSPHGRGIYATAWYPRRTGMLTKVGKYEIIEKIGVGGFGTVYRGRDPYIKRTVAIKTCQSDEDELRKRFFREAEFAGNLHHRNITTIYDFGLTDDGLPYIVQEFLTGEDLDRKIKRKDDLSLAWRVRVLADICDGLHYAHTSGIVHRDVKPSNIRILEDGTVKIMDFGIAKSMVTESTLTQTGITLGTASYLAPEQIRGEPVDARTDIFSLGVLAYELFTYTRPFTGDHISTVLYKIMNENPPSPAEVVPGLPPELVAVIEKTLEKDRSNRFSSCAELKASLMAVLEVLSGPVGAPPRSASGEEPLPSGPRTFGSARLDERLLVAPNGPSAAADLPLRPEPPSAATPAPLAPRPEETGSALKVFLGALAILVVVGGGLGWLLLGPGARKADPANGDRRALDHDRSRHDTDSGIAPFRRHRPLRPPFRRPHRRPHRRQPRPARPSFRRTPTPSSRSTACREAAS